MKLKIFSLVSLGLFIPFLCLAHGIGASQQKAAGSNVVEFEYDYVGDVPAGRFTLYTFRLIDPYTRADIPFDVAFARIQRADGTPVLSGYQYPMQQMGSMGASLGGILSEPGTYKAQVTFDKGVKQVASSSFEFYVFPDSSAEKKPDSSARAYLSLVIAALAGIIIGTLAGRIKKREKKS